MSTSPARQREIRPCALVRGTEAKTREATDPFLRQVSLVAKEAAAVRGFLRHVQTSTQVAGANVRAA